MARSLIDAHSAASCDGAHSLERRALIRVAIGDIKLLAVKLEIVHGVCFRRMQEFINHLGRCFRSKFDNCVRFLQGFALNQIQNDFDLSGRDSGAPQRSLP